MKQMPINIKPLEFSVFISPNGEQERFTKDFFRIGDIVEIKYSEYKAICVTKTITGRIHDDTTLEKLVIDISEKYKSELMVFSGVKTIRNISKES